MVQRAQVGVRGWVGVPGDSGVGFRESGGVWFVKGSEVAGLSVGFARVGFVRGWEGG